MFPHQRDVTGWALRLGPGRCILGTGLGKSLIEIDSARCVYEHTGVPVLLLAPLSVAYQMVPEGQKFGIHTKYCKTPDDACDEHIVVTNYERMDRFDAEELFRSGTG